MLNVCNLSKKYFTADGQIVALDNINLQVKEGEYIAIVGNRAQAKQRSLI